MRENSFVNMYGTFCTVVGCHVNVKHGLGDRAIAKFGLPLRPAADRSQRISNHG